MLPYCPGAGRSDITGKTLPPFEKRWCWLGLWEDWIQSHRAGGLGPDVLSLIVRSSTYREKVLAASISPPTLHTRVFVETVAFRRHLVV